MKQHVRSMSDNWKACKNCFDYKAMLMQRTDMQILCHHFGWQGRLRSMEGKYSGAVCELTASMTHAGKLIHFG